MSLDVNAWCPFAMLGVSPGTSLEDLRASFRRAALRSHPDKPGGSVQAFHAVQRAYNEILAVIPGAASCLAEDSRWVRGEAPPATSSAGAAPACDPWGVGGFDPWSSAKPQSGEVPDEIGDPLLDPRKRGIEETGVRKVKKKKKRKKAEWQACYFCKGKGKIVSLRLSVLPKTCPHCNGKGGRVDQEAPMREGIYGFRPDSSSDESSEPDDAYVTRPGPHGTGLNFGIAASSHQPERPALNFSIAGGAFDPWSSAQPQSGAIPQLTAQPPALANMPRGTCALHQKQRFLSDLAANPDGLIICKFGRECA